MSGTGVPLIQYVALWSTVCGSGHNQKVGFWFIDISIIITFYIVIVLNLFAMLLLSASMFRHIAQWHKSFFSSEKWFDPKEAREMLRECGNFDCWIDEGPTQRGKLVIGSGNVAW